MISEEEFVDAVFETAPFLGYVCETSRNGRQVILGHKKLHEGHMRMLHPKILDPDAHIPSLIEAVAPGRPCAHRPMREIIKEMGRGQAVFSA